MLYRPYSESIFDLKFDYDVIFWDLPVENKESTKRDMSKMFKIKYRCNLITSMH